MKLTLRFRGVDLDEPLRTLLHRRVQLALDRLLGPGSRVALAMADVNGPRGGRDKRLVLRVLEPGLPEVVIQEDGDDVAATVDRAVDRAARTCARRRARLRTGVAPRRWTLSPAAAT